MTVEELESKIMGRMAGIQEWLSAEHPECGSEQKHLGAGTPERAYWHYGYMTAIRDILEAMESVQL